MTPSEQFTYDLARRSFLALWSHANPQGKNGKELCDVLVVCDPHVIVFSVKHCQLPTSEDRTLAAERWRRSAVEKSCSQIRGAERWLRRATHVIRKDGSLGVPIPQPPRFHRIAVAVGAEGLVPISSGDYGHGFVHVWDAPTVFTVLSELDTVIDFVEFLAAVETWCQDGRSIVGQVEDLLALYLHKGRVIPTDTDKLILPPGLWQHVATKPENIARKEADKPSYAWDRFIEYFSESVLNGETEYLLERPGDNDQQRTPTLSENERALRLMARETRFARRILGAHLSDFVRDTTVEARLATSPSQVTYVFHRTPRRDLREHGARLLALRCLVARVQYASGPDVVGIGIVTDPEQPGSATNLVHLHIPEVTEAMRAGIIHMQQEMKMFTTPRVTREHHDEYPGACPDPGPSDT